MQGVTRKQTKIILLVIVLPGLFYLGSISNTSLPGHSAVPQIQILPATLPRTKVSENNDSDDYSKKFYDINVENNSAEDSVKQSLKVLKGVTQESHYASHREEKDSIAANDEVQNTEKEEEEEEEDDDDDNERKEVKKKRITSAKATVVKQKKTWPVSLDLSEGSALREIDYSTYAPEDRTILETRGKVMLQRARKIREVCDARPSGLDLIAKIHLVWDRKHTPSIVWCPNYKVASTSWMINFMRLAHFNEDNPDIPDGPDRDRLQFSAKYGATHKAVVKLYPEPKSPAEKSQTLQDSLRLIIVRHPFARILSAFRDKMQKKKPRPTEFGFRKLQKQIIARYRKDDSKTDSKFPTFPEFVQYIIDSTKKFKTNEDWRKVKCWSPYWSHCNVCNTDYNVIMKLETMAEDERFLITLANLEELKQLKKMEWRHLRNSSSSDIAPTYYSQLTRRQMKGLYQRYQPDFELFGYDIDDFLAIAKDSPSKKD